MAKTLSENYKIVDTLKFSKKQRQKSKKFLEKTEEFVGIFLINAKVHRTLTLLLKEKKTQQLTLKVLPVKLVNKFFEDEQEKKTFFRFMGQEKWSFSTIFSPRHDRQTDTQLLANPTQNKYFDRKINQCVKASTEQASKYRVWKQVCNRMH